MDAATLGQQLREAREARELTLEDAEQGLRIRKKYLVAFEAGDYADLPGAVQARGFLRNYARYLNLDDEQVLAHFDAIQQAAAPRRGLFNRSADVSQVGQVTVPIVESDYNKSGGSASNGGVSQSRRQVRLILGLILGVGLILACVVVGGFAVERLLNADANREDVNLMSILPTQPFMTATSVFIPSPTLLPGALVEAGSTPITGRVVLVIDVQQRSFLRVTSDGILAFEGIVSPGTQVQYQAQGALNIQASNGSALDVVFNNMPLGLLGLRGEAIDQTFTPDMVLTPTAPPVPATATLPPPPAEGTGGSGKSGQGDAGAGVEPTALPVPNGADDTAFDEPTALPIPGDADNTDGSLSPSPLPDLSGSGDAASPEALSPSATSVATATATPTVTVTATRTPTTTATPSPTFTPSYTPTPTETPVLPPRQTSTPIIEK